MKKEVVQEESAPAAVEPTEEAPVEPVTASKNQSEPAAPAASTEDGVEKSFPASGSTVETVDQQCCGGFAVKSRACTII